MIYNHNPVVEMYIAKFKDKSARIQTKGTTKLVLKNEFCVIIQGIVYDLIHGQG